MSKGSDWHRYQRQLEREAERQRRAEAAARKAAEKQAQQKYVAARHAEVELKNKGVERCVEELRLILRRGSDRPARVDLAGFYRQAQVPTLDLGNRAQPTPEPTWKSFAPREPKLIARALGGQARYQRRVERERERFAAAHQEYIRVEFSRQQEIARLRVEHAQKVQNEQQKVVEHNREVDDWIAGFRARSQETVQRYLIEVLRAVPLPKSFPRTVEVTFNPKAEQAVVRFELPGPDVVPSVRGYNYLQTRDEERVQPRPAREIDELYRSVVSQVSLLCLRDLFDADSKLDSVGFNGHVWSTNPATGQREYRCLISLSIDRDSIKGIDFRAVKPEICLKSLNALVSPHPYELDPIRPILDFDLSKFSFVAGMDAVSSLDSRPDLLQFNPTEFEHLVRQVFEATGLQGWTTTQSNDDGVDAVVVNPDSLVGGLSIVQAKRYSQGIGVSHIRELAGAIEEKKAGRGILVTTSWFSAVCWRKAKEHGRIELIDGQRLIYLIKEHLGKDVLIGIRNWPRNL